MVMSRTIRKGWVALVAGVLLQFGGCGPIVQDLALSAAWEFIWDNDVVFDLFGDDGPGLVTQ
jgi:hypothetical protein